MVTGAQVSLDEARVPIRNAWYMLLYAWDLARWHQKSASAVDDAPTLLGLLARVLEESTRALLRRQLGREHMRRAEVVRGIRGRIDFGASLKRLHFESGRAACEYSELSIDTLRNRILRSTVVRLSTDPRVSHTDPRQGAVLRGRLRDLGELMSGVRTIRVGSNDFSRIQLGRNDLEYRLPLAICELLHRLTIPHDTSGDHLKVALFRDEIDFPRLFEAFVRNFYRMRRTDCRVNSDRLSWHDELGCRFLPEMRTDTTLVTTAPPNHRLVIDTKFSTSTLATTQYGGQRIKSGNLYQIYTYLRTQEHLGEPHRCASGLLLYPTTQGTVDESVRVQGHLIRVATIDLRLPWEEVEQNLLRLSEEGLTGVQAVTSESSDGSASSAPATSSSLGSV